MNRVLKNFEDVEKALRPYIPLVKELTGKDTVLDRIVPLMKYLGNPEKQLKVIHVAGTSGKTSTAYFLSSLLARAKLKVGLTVSPHIDKITERTQINTVPISDKLFCQKLSEFLELVEESGIKPSYFELIYGFSIWLFNELDVDYAVIETGVGGLFDATNVMSNKDKVCVITDIGFDHMNLLGDTLAEITKQKVGIVHAGNVLLMYKQSDEIMSIIKSWVTKYKGTIYLTNEKVETETYGANEDFNQLADYQKRNWLLAYFVYRFLAKRDQLINLTNESISYTKRIVIPARMDVKKERGHLVIMDGAHNYQKMMAFISSYKHKYPNTKPTILLAYKSDKAYVETLPELIKLASEIIVTKFKTSQDLPVKSCPPKEIADEVNKLGYQNVSIEQDNLKAYKKLMNSKSKNLVITGSFYLIAQIREKLRND